MRLPETMKMFLRESPFFWNNEKKLKKLYDYIKKFNLDPENSFELMHQRGSGKLTAKAKKRSYKKCKPQTRWGRGKIFPYPDKSKKILNEPENWKLLRVATLCEQGKFEQALSIANGPTAKRPIMINVINHYRQGPISLAPDSDFQNTKQPIFDIAPPPLPPHQDPGKDKKQAKKKDKSPEKLICQLKKGHTFDKHGSHNTHRLKMEAKNSRRSQGQWIDDIGAENFIAKNLDRTKNGTIMIELPKGLGRVVHPDGTFSPATHAILVPSGSGVKTAYPVPSTFRIR